jgi:hypothetical protein
MMATYEHMDSASFSTHLHWIGGSTKPGEPGKYGPSNPRAQGTQGPGGWGHITRSHALGNTGTSHFSASGALWSAAHSRHLCCQ